MHYFAWMASVATLQQSQFPFSDSCSTHILNPATWCATAAQAQLYYELLSNFMGKGDKETFAYALLATGGSYALVPKPVGAVGVNKCALDSSFVFSLFFRFQPPLMRFVVI